MDDRKINHRCSEADVCALAARDVRVQGGCAASACSVATPAVPGVRASAAGAACPWPDAVDPSESSAAAFAAGGLVVVVRLARVHAAAPASAPAVVVAFAADLRAVARLVRVVSAFAPAALAPEAGAVAVVRAVATGFPADAVAGPRDCRLIAARARPAAPRAGVRIAGHCVAVHLRAGSPGHAARFRVRRDARSARWAIRPRAEWAASA